MALASSIQHHMNEWYIVHINVAKNSDLSQQEIMQRFVEQYEESEGLIYPASDLKVVMLVRLGKVHSYLEMKEEIESHVPGHSCRILMRKMTKSGLQQLQVDLLKRSDDSAGADDLYHQRVHRQENIILIADDDAFVRKSLSAVVASCGTIHEAEDADATLKAYQQYNPDILFLDIHMPGRTGLDIIEDIIKLDPDAFIVISSADSQQTNIVKALEHGAAGFLTKPPAKGRIHDYINQCLTLH